MLVVVKDDAKGGVAAAGAAVLRPNALASARETGGNLDSSRALGYIESLDDVLLDKLDHIRSVLAKNAR